MEWLYDYGLQVVHALVRGPCMHGVGVESHGTSGAQWLAVMML